MSVIASVTRMRNCPAENCSELVTNRSTQCREPRGSLEESFDHVDAFVRGSKLRVAAQLGDDVLRTAAGEHHRNAAEAGGFHRRDAEVLQLFGKLEFVHAHPGRVNENGRAHVELRQLVAADIRVE